MNKKKYIKMLNELLAEYGVSAQFKYNMRHHGKRGVSNTEELINHIFKKGFKLRNTIFLAFYWNCDREKGRGDLYWSKIANEWRRRLNNDRAKC